MAKHLKVIEVYFLKKLKYFDIFKKKILHGFYNKFVNSQRILAYISKILNFFIYFNTQDYELIHKTYF
jgi:hypothetical protein